VQIEHFLIFIKHFRLKSSIVNMPLVPLASTEDGNIAEGRVGEGGCAQRERARFRCFRQQLHYFSQRFEARQREIIRFLRFLLYYTVKLLQYNCIISCNICRMLFICTYWFTVAHTYGSTSVSCQEELFSTASTISAAHAHAL
jgi:hypothetical protein